MRLTPLNKEVRRAREAGGAKWRTQDVTRWLLIVSVYALVVLLSCTYMLRDLPLGGGAAIRSDVYVEAPFSVELPSKKQRWLEEVEQAHRRVWDYQSAVGDDVVAQLGALLSRTDGIDPELHPPTELVAMLRRQDNRLVVNEALAAGFLTILRDGRFREAMKALVSEAYRDQLITDNAVKLRAHLAANLAVIRGRGGASRDVSLVLGSRDLADWGPLVVRRFDGRFYGEQNPEKFRDAALQVLAIVVRPNVVLNEAQTERERQDMLDRAPADLWRHYSVGDLLVRANPATPVHAEDSEPYVLLEAHRHAAQSMRWKRLPGHMLYVLLVFVILSFYVHKSGRVFTTSNVALLSLPVLLALSIMALILLFNEGDPGMVGYLFPAGMIGMLGVLLLDVRMALLLVTWGCLLHGLQVDLQYDFVITGLFGGYTAVAALFTIRKRYEVFVASILIGVVNLLVIMGTGYIERMMGLVGAEERRLLAQGALGLASGLASFLVLAILPVFERFGVVTDMQLLELTGLHHPLLRRLEEEAPGTWQHTLNVAKLAEAAASEIGVNYLLVRAGCYYHDIGKVSKPEYFTENQITPEDKMRHSELKPQMSALIIKNHVKEGMEMARAANLPERIVDFIREHHGTSVISYFYLKAVEAHNRGEIKEPVRVEDYRYPWNKPQTIETAIVMLADAVEATATAKLSNKAVREDDIQQLVRTTIFDKFNDGQFNECNLTLRDLEVIRETFVGVLKSRFHTRIDYPRKPLSGSRTSASKEVQREDPRRTESVKRPEAAEPTPSQPS